jgi:hypothetical protein
MSRTLSRAMILPAQFEFRCPYCLSHGPHSWVQAHQMPADVGEWANWAGVCDRCGLQTTLSDLSGVTVTEDEPQNRSPGFGDAAGPEYRMYREAAGWQPDPKYSSSFLLADARNGG